MANGLNRISLDLLGAAERGRTIPVSELYLKPTGPADLTLLDGSVVRNPEGRDPREALLEWIRDPANPWFATAFVNRVWASCFHTGIIDPPDDLTAANPPANGPLLEHLVAGFRANGHDLRWLLREIAKSDAYQRSWQTNSSNAADRRNFSHAVPRRLPAEVVYDALKQAVAAPAETQSVRENLERRAVGHLAMRMSNTYAMNIFGKPERATNCDCARSAEPSLLQSLFLKNDPLVQGWVEDGGWVSGLRELESRGDAPPASEALVREAFLRVLSRPPSDAEMVRALAHLKESTALSAGVADLVWALVNTREFILNH